MSVPGNGRDMTLGQFGRWAILDADLTVDRVPEPGSPFFPDVAEFALSFDGYEYRGDQLADWARGHESTYMKTGELDGGLPLPDLRALLFWEQRSIRTFGSGPTASEARYIDALLAAIRARVGA